MLEHWGDITKRETTLPVGVIIKLNAYAERLERLFVHTKELCPTCTWNGNEREDVKRGCCVRCASAQGYFAPSMWKTVGFLKKRYGWNDKYGFFDSNAMRCALPRVRRSTACSRYVCARLAMTAPLPSMQYHRTISRLVRMMEVLKARHNIAF